ncbi:dethiobiotin synthetase [Modicisalibacter muralis]|uniref:ATP-dependent dethiobiotin synthetase BioD n=1 Tax=Modicisalibacter muralis TaxID=119000 RepID=A0A1G9MSV0_9GAMM|nr:dethiobiotin synthase [Halomonas muralis]SDL77193.1 dethiobiotin synthetase [Halomonas muralis]
MRRYFVTGTDTDAGKTLVAAAMLAKARRRGLTTLGLKPVAAGCEHTPDGLRNADALALQAFSYPGIDYTVVNPIALKPPIAPHLAAARANWTIRLAQLHDLVAAAMREPRDLTLIEGAGGWRVPLNDDEDLSGLAGRLDLPVILVVGLRLGCINHARLTLEAIRAEGLAVAGWVASQVDPEFAEREANLATLRAHLPAPCLGVIPWLGDNGDDLVLAERAADYLDLPGD